jgi:hypothetical protein
MRAQACPGGTLQVRARVNAGTNEHVLSLRGPRFVRLSPQAIIRQQAPSTSPHVIQLMPAFSPSVWLRWQWWAGISGCSVNHAPLQPCSSYSHGLQPRCVMPTASQNRRYKCISSCSQIYIGKSAIYNSLRSEQCTTPILYTTSINNQLALTPGVHLRLGNTSDVVQ